MNDIIIFIILRKKKKNTHALTPLSHSATLILEKSKTELGLKMLPKRSLFVESQLETLA